MTMRESRQPLFSAARQPLFPAAVKTAARQNGGRSTPAQLPGARSAVAWSRLAGDGVAARQDGRNGGRWKWNAGRILARTVRRPPDPFAQIWRREGSRSRTRRTRRTGRATGPAEATRALPRRMIDKGDDCAYDTAL